MRAATTHPNAAAVSDELARVLKSEPFARSARQRKFLSLVVDLSLRGKEVEIKELTLAVALFDRRAGSFDAQRDPIVRVEAARLRQKLDRYYRGVGAGSGLRIDIPKGHYRPVFVDMAQELPGLRRNGLAPHALPEEHALADHNSRLLPSHDSRAGDCFYRGRYASRQRDVVMYKKAIELFRKAIAVDPGFAQAYASLAMALYNIAAFVSSPSGPLIAEAHAAAQQAIALDPESGEACVALAAYAHRIDRDWPEAERLFRRALVFAPQSSNVHAGFGSALITRGRFDEAASHLHCARELDPLNVGLLAGNAQNLYYLRRYGEAETELSALLEIFPQHAFAECMRGLNALYSGKPVLARAAFERASAILPDHPSPYLLIPAALALEGRSAEARHCLDAALDGLTGQYYCRYHLAIANAYLHDREGLYTALDAAANLGDILLVSLPVEPAFDDYRDDARFRAFVEQQRLALVDPNAIAALQRRKRLC